MARRIPEDDLLAFIEGDLPADREADVRAALEADPDLMAWVDAAKADRSMLQQWGRAGASIAPPDLVEQAMRQAERDALLGAAGLDDEHRPRVLFRFTGPRTAMAAMVVAALGLGVIYGPGLVQQWSGSTAGPPSTMPEAGRTEPLASADPVEERRTAMAPAFDEAVRERALGAAPAMSRQEAEGRSPMALADADQRTDASDASLAEVAGADRNANGVPAEPLLLALEEEASKSSLDAADALASLDADLPADGAATGRLRAIGTEDEAGEAAIAAAPASMTLAQATALASSRQLLVAITAPDAEAFAADVRETEAALRVSPMAGDVPVFALLVEIPADEAGLDAFLQATGALGASSVRLLDRGDPLGAGSVRGASDVLWWTRPPSEWPGRGSALELRIMPAPRLPDPPGGD